MTSCLTITRLYAVVAKADVNDTITSFWELETAGVKELLLPTKEDNFTLSHVQDAICHKETRCEVRLPWKKTINLDNDKELVEPLPGRKELPLLPLLKPKGK